MAEHATPLPRQRLEMSLVQARTRFAQLARLAGLAQQVTVVTDGGRPVAAIVPVSDVRGDDDAPSASAAGWVRRIEKLREDLHRQHAVLERALDEAWKELDTLSPPGSDAAMDALRSAHADLRRPQ